MELKRPREVRLLDSWALVDHRDGVQSGRPTRPTQGGPQVRTRRQTAFLDFFCVSAIASVIVLTVGSPAVAQCTDADGDGVFYEGECGTARDCNDADPSTFPGAVEHCDGIDNDCTGRIDDVAGCRSECFNPTENGVVDVSEADPGNPYPHLVWNGATFGVAWDAPNNEIHFRQLDRAGQVLTPEVVVEAGPGYWPWLVWTGTEYGLFHLEGATASVILRRLDRAGSALAPAVNVGPLNRAAWFGIAWNGHRYGLVTFESGALVLRVLDARGNEVAGPYPIADGPIGTPAVAWSGQNFGVVWDSAVPAPGIKFAEVSPSGLLVGPPTLVSAAAPGLGDAWPWIVWAGDRYTLTWGSSHTAYVRQVAPGSTPLGEDISVAPASPGWYPRLAWTGREHAVTWVGNGGRGFFRRLAANGTPLDAEVLMSTNSVNDNWPSPAWNGESYVVANVDRDLATSAHRLQAWRLLCTDTGTVCRNPRLVTDPGTCVAAATCDEVAACQSGTAVSCDPTGPYSVGATMVLATCAPPSDPPTASCTVSVRDAEPPFGGITSPADGVCLATGTTIQDDFADNCDLALQRLYNPGPGPTYDDHGDHSVRLTVNDSAGNTSQADVGFTIDTEPPTVQILFAFKTDNDDDGASGGVVHEIIRLNGCVIYDGLTFGDGDGLLSDEEIEVSQPEICRVTALCGFDVLNSPEIVVEAEDCAGNIGSDRLVFEGELLLRPGICGR